MSSLMCMWLCSTEMMSALGLGEDEDEDSPWDSEVRTKRMELLTLSPACAYEGWCPLISDPQTILRYQVLLVTQFCSFACFTYRCSHQRNPFGLSLSTNLKSRINLWPERFCDRCGCVQVLCHSEGKCGLRFFFFFFTPEPWKDSRWDLKVSFNLDRKV